MAEAKKSTRRSFLKRGAAVGAGVAGAGLFLGGVNRVSRAAGKKVIIIGIDGMDPRLSESMMAEGQLPNLAKMRAAGGFSPLGTSTPPQSPVAWANFINGAGPGSHGIFDFIHRRPDDLRHPFFSAAEIEPGEGGWEVGDHKIPLDFWPFNDRSPTPVLRRQGTPFWDYLDEAGVPTTFYDLPSNYPPSPSRCGHHRCLCGMGTPDLRGTYGTYHYFSEDGPAEERREQGGSRYRITFENETAHVALVGPEHSLLKHPKPLELELLVHRDQQANAAVLQVSGQRVVLKPGQWSKWVRLDFTMSMPSRLPDKTVSGICRFYLQRVASPFRLYVSPINVDPRDPLVQISEPASFVTDIAKQLGPFYTTGFQEDHAARRNEVFDDEEYLRQANYVLEERLKLLEHAIQNYDDGLLFFYFSSSDLQSHMFWWEGNEEHPSRPPEQARRFHGHIKALYRRLDAEIGNLHNLYGSVATIIVMSDHGFANFGWQFNLNAWLRDWNYLQPNECPSIMSDQMDWSRTKAYGLGINGLYLNLKGREPHGIVEPHEVDELVEELTNRLVEATKFNDQPVVRGVYRSAQIYKGEATALAPDLIVGYHRGFRASWASVLGDMTAPDPETGELKPEQTFSKNTAAWSADHCADALEVPGVFWCSEPIRGQNPSLVDMAPSILALYGLPTPPTMTGRDVLGE